MLECSIVRQNESNTALQQQRLLECSIVRQNESNTALQQQRLLECSIVRQNDKPRRRKNTTEQGKEIKKARTSYASEANKKDTKAVFAHFAFF